MSSDLARDAILASRLRPLRAFTDHAANVVLDVAHHPIGPKVRIEVEMGLDVMLAPERETRSAAVRLERELPEHDIEVGASHLYMDIEHFGRYR